MHRTTHPLPPAQTAQAEALAELHTATLVIDNPVHTQTASEFVSSTNQPTATWYAPHDTRPALEDALTAMGHTNLVWEPVDETADYVAQTAHLFPDITIGPFTITRDETKATQTPTTIYIPPNQAFGSGEHATTSGCLLALEYLIEQDHTFSHALDYGAGSAILALGAAKRLGIPVTCADNEEPAVRIALENAAANGVAPLITSFHAETPAHLAVMAQAPYPLVFANILLNPLLALATPLQAALAEGGYLILAGFRTEQEADIRTTYAHLTPIHHQEADGWVILTYRK